MVEQPTHITISGAEMAEISRLWDNTLDYVQDATPQARYDRLEKHWREHTRQTRNLEKMAKYQVNGKLSFEKYLAIHSAFHYSQMAHGQGRRAKKHYSDEHWPMYLFYEAALPLLLYRHKDVMQLSELKDMRRIYFGPREIGKSVALRIVLMWIMYHDPTLRILYGKAKVKDAEKAISWILRQYEINALIESFFPDYHVANKAGRPTPWNRQEILLPSATGANMRATPESSFTAGGVDSGETGGHYDLFAPDDYVTDKNTRSKVGLEHTIKVFGEMFSVMGEEGLWLGCGTSWDQEDAYAWLRGIYTPEGGEAPAAISCLVERATTECNAEGDLCFPTIHTSLEKLRDLRDNRIGQFLYSCLYDNDPTAKSNCTFAIEDTRFFQLKHIVEKDYRLPIHVIFDGAGTTTSTSDNAAIDVIAFDHMKPPNLYVLEVYHGRMQDDHIIKVFKDLYDYYREWPYAASVNFWMQHVVFEGKYRKLIHHFLQKERPGFQIFQLERNTRIPKWQEIAALQLPHSRGQVFMRVREDCDFADLPINDHKAMIGLLHSKGLKQLYKEIRSHLRGRRDQDDNCVDALSQTVKILNRRAHQVFEPMQKIHTFNSEEQLRRQKRSALAMDFSRRFEAGDLHTDNVLEAIGVYRDRYGWDNEDEGQPFLEAVG